MLPEDVLCGTNLDTIQMGGSYYQPVTADVPQNPCRRLEVPECARASVVNVVWTEQAAGIAPKQVTRRPVEVHDVHGIAGTDGNDQEALFEISQAQRRALPFQLACLHVGENGGRSRKETLHPTQNFIPMPDSGDAESDEAPSMLYEPEVAVVRRKSVLHLVSVNENHLRPGLSGFHKERHSEVWFNQPIVRPVRDPSEMNTQYLAFVNREYPDGHGCAGEPKNLTYGTSRFGEMRLEYLIELVLPFSFVEENWALERLQFQGRKPTPLDIGARYPFSPSSPGMRSLISTIT